MRVEQSDREAAASAYFAWLSGNPVIPAKMTAGRADDHSMVQAFAAHRQRGHGEAVKAIVEWLRRGAMFAATDQEVSDAIERGEPFKNQEEKA